MVGLSRQSILLVVYSCAVATGFTFPKATRPSASTQRGIVQPAKPAPVSDQTVIDSDATSSPLRDTLQALQALRPRGSQRIEPTSDMDTGSKPAAGKLVVVSNRLPFSVKPGAEGYQFLMSSGGLVSAMLGVMAADTMTWVGWPGIAAEGEVEQSLIRAQLAQHK